MELSHADVEGVWHKDGLRVKPSGQVRVSANGRVHGLTLSNLSLEDTGTIAFSAEGVRTTARLTVKGMRRRWVKGPMGSSDPDRLCWNPLQRRPCPW